MIYNYVLYWHEKKCCNCYNFVPCFLWDFIVLDLVLSWWRIEHKMKNQCNFAIGSREGFPRKKHMTRSWRVIPDYQFRECLASKAFLQDSRKTFCLEDFKEWLSYASPILYIPSLSKKYVKLFRGKKTLNRFSTTQHTHLLERELLIFSEKSL